MKLLLFSATVVLSSLTWAQSNQSETNYQIKRHEQVVGSKETLQVSPCVIRFEMFGKDHRYNSFCRYKGTYNILERFEKQSWIVEDGRIYPGSFRTDKIVESTLKEETIDVYDYCLSDNAERLCNSRRIQYTVLINSLDSKAVADTKRTKSNSENEERGDDGDKD